MKTDRKLTGRGLHRIFEQVRGGAIGVAYADGTIEQYGAGEPQFAIRFRDEDIFKVLGDSLSLLCRP